jgi:hypothetical protein
MVTLFFRPAILTVLLFCLVYGKEDAGLILSGLDTLWTNKLIGFDFVTQTACTSSSDYPGCYRHIYFQDYTDIHLHYDLRIEVRGGAASEYSMKMGKVNLDSIKLAPPDSILYTQPIGKIDSIPPDSLSSRVGNVYVLKTGTDPRPVWNRPFYAKIKVVKFIVVDSASHSIKMVFLWAFNRSGYPDLTTSGLDTFHLDSVPTAIREAGIAAPRVSGPAGGRYVFKVVGDRFVVPEGLVGKKCLGVYDLMGKKLGEIFLKEAKTVNIAGFVKARGILVIRVEW